jgi:RNA recognition motif-containing protein
MRAPIVACHFNKGPLCSLCSQRDRPKGIAYVEMADIATATRAVRDLDGKDFEGRPLKLDFAAPKGGHGGGFDGRGGRGGRGGQRGRGGMSRRRV